MDAQTLLSSKYLIRIIIDPSIQGLLVKIVLWMKKDLKRSHGNGARKIVDCLCIKKRSFYKYVPAYNMQSKKRNVQKEEGLL